MKPERISQVLKTAYSLGISTMVLPTLKSIEDAIDVADDYQNNATMYMNKAVSMARKIREKIWNGEKVSDEEWTELIDDLIVAQDRLAGCGIVLSKAKMLIRRLKEKLEEKT